MTSADVRARLTNALRLDLIGPEPGEPQAGEVLGIPPSRFYLTGFLAPLNAPVSQKADDDEQRVQILRAEATNFPVSAVFEKEDYANGNTYYPLDDLPLNPPGMSTGLPASERVSRVAQ